MSRLLFCESSANLGGQELQILRQMEVLAGAGHEPLLACHPASGIARQAAARRLPWRPVAFRKGLHPPSIVSLRRLLAAERVEVAFCHSGADSLALALAARLLVRRPLLIRVRTYQPGRPKAFSHNVLVDRTFVRSEHMRRRMLSNPAVRPERIGRIPAILPLDDIRAQAALPLPEALAAKLATGSPVIVQAAMLRPEKGHRVALAALARLRSRFPGLLYAVAGAGPEEAALRALAQQLGMAQAVHFAGMVMPIYPLLARAELVLMPSLDEPLGFAQIEALALGVPVAVSDAGGLPETVTQGETGWIVRAGDVDAWAEAIAQALSDPGRARAMAQKGRAFVEAHFSPQAYLERIGLELEAARRSREHRG